MKIRKQLKRLENLLDAGKRKRFRRRDELKRLLHDMKSKERHLKEKAEAEDDADEKARLQREIVMLHAQRRKGVAVLKEMDARADGLSP